MKQSKSSERRSEPNEVKDLKEKIFSPFVLFSFSFFSIFFFRKKARRQKNKKKERYTPRGGDEEGKRERSIKIWFQESESYDTFGKIRASYDGFYALA